jgi:pyrimidine operon attenuation protein/uracil phosphoribosyltransferase
MVSSISDAPAAFLCVLIDRGHREMPIEAQFVGRTVQTSETEIIEVRLREIDNEERVVLVDRQEP